MRLVTLLALLCLGLVNASPIAAQSNGNQGNGNNGNNGNQGNGNNPPSATPELSSLVLFGAGAAGVASYGLMRLRASRRNDEDQEAPTTRT